AFLGRVAIHQSLHLVEGGVEIVSDLGGQTRQAAPIEARALRGSISTLPGGQVIRSAAAVFFHRIAVGPARLTGEGLVDGRIFVSQAVLDVSPFNDRRSLNLDLGNRFQVAARAAAAEVDVDGAVAAGVMDAFDVLGTDFVAMFLCPSLQLWDEGLGLRLS